MHKGARALRASCISILALAISGCGLQSGEPFLPRNDHRSESIAAQANPQAVMPPLPTTVPTYTPDESGNEPATRPAVASLRGDIDRNPTIRMSLSEIIHRSVANSREVRVAGYDAAVAKTRILENQAKFDPVAYSVAQYSDQKVLSPSNGNLVTNPFNPQVFRTLDLQTGLKQQLASGGTVDLRYEIQRIQQVPAGSVNPYFLDDVVLQITQPLLQNFGYAANEARITIARNDYRVSVLDFRNKLETNLIELERDYWQLVEAEEELRIQKDLLARSQDTYRILIERSTGRGGDITRVQLSQAYTRVKSEEAVLIQAEGRIGDISDDIKSRMNDPQFPVASPVIILSMPNSAMETQVHFDWDEQIQTGLLNRFELGQQQVRIDSAAIAAGVAFNNLEPKLDMTASLNVQGPGRDIGRAFDQQGRSNFIGGVIGFNFEYPLGNRQGRSIYRRAMLQRIQAMTQYKFLTEKVTTEVKQALRAVETDWRELGRRREARLVAGDYMDSLNQQRDIGGIRLDSEFVQLLLNAEEQFAQAERDEALALNNYNVSIARLEQAKGTLLRYDNVVLEEEKFITMEQ